MKKLLIALLVVLLLSGLIIGLLFFFWTAENVALLAQKAMDSEDYPRAIRFYETACELDPDNPAYPIALSEACLAGGNYTKAERYLVNSLRKSPSSVLYLKLSALYVAQDKLMDAQEMLDNINDPVISEELNAKRPAAPEFSHKGGEYAEYISVALSASGGTVYYSNSEEYPSLATPYAQPIELTSGDSRIAAITVSEEGLVSALVSEEYLIRGVVEDVTFASPELEAYVRETLYIPRTESITTEDLWGFTELTVSSDVTDLSDLRHFVNLTSLTIQKSTAQDFSFLAYTTELQNLDLRDSEISTEAMELIGRLKKLERLDLYSCGVSNITALSGCTALTYLDLSENSISDISPIANATMLQELNLSSNAVSALGSLSDLTQLVTLDLSSNNIQDISVLGNCAKLETLNITDNRVNTIAALAQLTRLRTLNAASNNIADASVLVACPDLSVLNLSENALTEISVLSSLEKLTELDVSYNEIAKLPDLKDTCALSKVNFSHNVLTDISVLAGLVNLHTVNVEYNAELKDIECLATCYMLMRVDAFGTKVTEVKALTDMGVVVNYDPSIAINQN